MLYPEEAVCGDAFSMNNDDDDARACAYTVLLCARHEQVALFSFVTYINAFHLTNNPLSRFY